MAALGTAAQSVACAKQFSQRSVRGRAQQQHTAAAASPLGFGSSLSCTQPSGASRLRASATRRQACVLATSEGANPFAKFGRVLQEKAKADFERVFAVRGRSAPFAKDSVSGTFLEQLGV